MKRFLAAILVMLLAYACTEAPAPENRPAPKPNIPKEETYDIYLGNTHAHSHYSGDAVQEGNTPDDHFRLAKQYGYDFYAVTDHSQYEQYNEAAWQEIHRAAEAYTGPGFVGMRGYEHSENNGPGAKGHMNVYQTSTYLNALESGIDMQYFQDWLCTAVNSSSVVSMNHPGENQYNGFQCCNEAVRSRITLIELINGPKCDDYYSSYLIALKKGWKVSPVAGADFHNLNKIGTWPARTGVAAKALTRSAIIESFADRRTYATYEKTMEVIYYVNGYVMGSADVPKTDKLNFEISVSTKGSDITRVEICTEDGECVKGKDFKSKDIFWQTDVVREHEYYFVNVYTGQKETPTAYAAPIWTK